MKVQANRVSARRQTGRAMKTPGEPKLFMTTEQLMEKVSQEMEKMSPEEKLEVRRALDKAFPPREAR